MKLFELQDRPEQDKNFDRNIMPQIRKDNLQNSPFEFKKGKIRLDKLKPVQNQRVKGMHDKAKQGFADGSIRPIIVDKDNYIVNGHHRYDVARGLELDKVRVLKVDASVEDLIDHFTDTASPEPTYEEIMKAKLDSLMETIEASQDISALMKGIEADLKQREKDLKRLPKKSVYEAPIIRPADSYDPNANDAYNFATKRKPPKYDYDPEVDYRPGKSIGRIPNIQSQTEVIQMPNRDLYLFYVNNSKQGPPVKKTMWQKFVKAMLHNPKANQTGPNKEKNVIGFLKLKPYQDGYKVAGVGMDPEIRGQGKAIKLYLAFSAWKGVPIYSDYTQTPRAKTMWQSIIGRYPKRVVAYDQNTKKEMPIDDIDDMYQDEPEGFSDLRQSQAKDVLSKTILFKLLPESVQEGEVVPINKGAPGEHRVHSIPPYFSDAEAERAADEYYNQAQIDQEDGVLITSEDGKNYRIFKNEGENQHFAKDEIYLVNDEETNPTEYIDKHGYDEVEELLYHHSKHGYYVDMDENFADGKVKGKSIDEGPKDFDNMNLDQKGKQDSIDYFYHTHAPTFGKPTKAGSFKGHNVVTFKTPDGTLMFLVNRNDQVVFYVGLTKMPDGVAVGNVRSNGTIKATEVYRYLVSKYGKLYSDKHQTPDGRKIWANLAKYNPELKISDIGDRLMATENFADGKKKGKSRPGRVKRAGASCKGSVTSLRKKAKNSSGEKSKMYHWCANMKGGRKKS